MDTAPFSSPLEVCRLSAALVLGLAAASGARSTPAPGVSVADVHVLPTPTPESAQPEVPPVVASSGREARPVAASLGREVRPVGASSGPEAPPVASSSGARRSTRQASMLPFLPSTRRRPSAGGTLAILPDGVTAVAADPDRDTIAVVNLTTSALTANIALQPHDEPGRLVADGRRARSRHSPTRGALVTIDPVAGTILVRRTACPIPRGVAYDPATDLVHVACMGGELVSFPAAGGAATRTLQLPRDLRDIVVDGDTLLVSQFRSAQVLVIDANGNISSTIAPPVYGDRRHGWERRSRLRQPGGCALNRAAARFCCTSAAPPEP